MKQKLSIFLLCLTMWISTSTFAEDIQPKIINIEVVNKIDKFLPFTWDQNKDGIVDLYDIVLVAKKIPEYLQEVIQHYGETLTKILD